MDYRPRKLEEKLDKWMDRKEVLLLKGPRQAGKSTLLLHLKNKFGGNYVTLEDEDVLETFKNNPKTFAQRFMDKNKQYLFIDEAQYCKKAGKIIKLLFDLYSDKLKLIVTGSGSFDIRVEIGKYLVGRAIYFELLPLSFEEFLLWKSKDLHKLFLKQKKSIVDFVNNGKKFNTKPSFTKEFETLLNEYLVFGGFPAVVKEDNKNMKKELLRNLSRTYLEKDIFFFFNINHIEKFRKVLKYLGFNMGSLLVLSNITEKLNMDYKTAEKYLSILSNTFIASLIPSFHKNLTTELKKSKKIYFTDTGIRNSMLNNFLSIDRRTDKGPLLENFVLNELKSVFERKVNYWRTTGKAEVDFVLQPEKIQKPVPVEVKSKGKPGKGFLSFIKNYKPKRAVVFTEKGFGIKKMKGTDVAFVPHFFI